MRVADCSVPGPNVFGISSDTPEGCTVDQAVYVSRHGSRYPDPGAYDGWLALYDKVTMYFESGSE
jgi:acid phosphatase